MIEQYEDHCLITCAIKVAMAICVLAFLVYLTVN